MGEQAARGDSPDKVLHNANRRVQKMERFDGDLGKPQHQVISKSNARNNKANIRKPVLSPRYRQVRLSPGNFQAPEHGRA